MIKNITEIAPVLVIGSKGQLGQALMQRVPNPIGFCRKQIDLTKPNLKDILAKQLRGKGPIRGIINAAAYTAVDKAESEVEIANQINGNAPGQLASFCANEGIPLVHISTDYVFSGGRKTPYSPDDETSPINTYGRSKLMGEIAIEKTEAISAILRTSWVYDGHNPNFFTSMLRLGGKHDVLNIVGDQIGRPTYTVDLAEAATLALNGLIKTPGKRGIYHVSNTGEAVSWAQFAIAIFIAAKMSTKVSTIATSEYPTSATRPAYSVMDTRKFENAFGHILPDWKDGLIRAEASR